MARARARHNGEGSIYPYRNGYAAYAWVTTPTGKRARKYVYGPTREAVHDKWIKLLDAARKGPVATKSPTVAEYLERWLVEVVKPTVRPKTAEAYENRVRLYIIPGLGAKRLDKLSVRDVRLWLNELASRLARPTIQSARATLRTALANAISEDLIVKNPAVSVKIPNARPARRVKPWTVEEARRFLESAKRDRDPFYAAYVLILVLGLRRAEVLGLAWPAVRLDACEIYITETLQRIKHELVLGGVKTEASDAPLPLPGICVAALRERQKVQDEDRARAGEAWQGEHGLVFTTKYGTPIEPRNFVRSFKARCQKAGVPAIKVHGTRHTCGSLLAALDVHPRVAMQILRHSKINVTMEIYTQVPSPVTQEALKRLGASLDGPGERGK